MKKHTLLIVALFLTSLTALPSPACADVISRSVTKLSNTVSLHTITFDMGFLNADLWMPIAELKKTGTSSAGYVGANTMGRALILSSADIEKNVYYVPAGKRAEFTLVALTYSNPERGISISGLPHYIQRNGESKQLRQMPSEDLKEFTSIAP